MKLTIKLIVMMDIRIGTVDENGKNGQENYGKQN